MQETWLEQKDEGNIYQQEENLQKGDNRGVIEVKMRRIGNKKWENNKKEEKRGEE